MKSRDEANAIELRGETIVEAVSDAEVSPYAESLTLKMASGKIFILASSEWLTILEEKEVK
jgi:hypothetical protein